jgi:ABC-type transporter Mla subunit MlaD
MNDPTTKRIIELQTRLAVRLEQLKFTGVPAANVSHRLAEATALAKDIADESLPLFLEVSLDHQDALASLLAHIKLDLDELRDVIMDLEPDLTELLKLLRGDNQ